MELSRRLFFRGGAAVAASVATGGVPALAATAGVAAPAAGGIGLAGQLAQQGLNITKLLSLSSAAPKIMETLRTPERA